MTENCRVFVTHSSIDRELAEAIVNALRLATDLPSTSVFCSSIDGIDVPSGSDFLDYIRAQLDETTLVVPLITPAYLDSLFCQWELGAIWSRDLRIAPIRFDPIAPSELPELLRHRQVKPLGAPALNAIASAIASQSGLPLNQNVWDRERQRFLDSAPEMLDALAPAWRDTPLARQRQLARTGQAMTSLAEAHEAIRDAGFLFFSSVDMSDRSFRLMLREAARTMATVFREATGVPCRITIKQVIVLDHALDESAVLGVEDLVRDRGAHSPGSDFIGENTDFERIVVNKDSYFFCNDLVALTATGEYKNSHLVVGRELGYRSTIVWPIRKLHEDPDDRLGADVTPGQDLVGFLCVDAAIPNAFDHSHVAIGTGLASALYLLLRPFLFEDEEFDDADSR